jgi:hypothetical protein
VYSNFRVASNNENDKLPLIGVGDEVGSVEGDRVKVESSKLLEEQNRLTENYDIDELILDAPLKLIGNWYDIETFTIANGTGNVFVRKDYWTVLMKKFITTGFFDFKWRYLRADMELCFTIGSNPTDYGSFVVSWSPTDLLNLDGSVSSFDMLNSDPTIFDISTGGTHIVTYPFSSIWDCYDMRNHGSLAGFRTSYPRFYLINMPAGSVGANGVLTATVRVRARFTNVKVWGSTQTVMGIYDDTATTLMKEMDVSDVQFCNQNVVTSQMRTRGVPELSESAMYAIENGANPYDYMPMGYNGPGVRTRGIRDFVNYGKTIAKLASTASTVYGGYDWFKSNKDLNSLVHSENGNERRMVPYKGESNSGDRLEITEGHVLNEPSFYGEMTGFEGQSRENLSFSMAGVPPKGLNDDLSHKISDIMRRPCIYQALTIAEGSNFVMNCIPLDPVVSSASLHFDYLAQFAQFFRYWRGSIDYDLHFHGSALFTSRITISVVHYGGDISQASTNTDFLFKDQFEVTGYRCKKIRIPFVWIAKWCKTDSTSFNDFIPVHPTIMTIAVEDISSSIGSTTVPPAVVLTICRSAGPDFQVRNIVGNNWISPAVTAVSQMRVNMKGSGYENFCRGEEEPRKWRPTIEDNMTVEDLLRRWSLRNGFNPVPSYPVHGSNMYNINPLPDLFDYVLNMFKYVRGNIDFKVPVDQTLSSPYYFLTASANTGIEGGYIPDSNGTSAGVAYTVPQLNPLVNFCAPIESFTEWTYTAPNLNRSQLLSYQPLLIEINNSIETSPAFCFVRAGPDFQIAYLQPPLLKVCQVSNPVIKPPPSILNKTKTAWF